MKEKTQVFEVRKTFIREDIAKDKIIFELKEYDKTGESEWVYISPNAQENTQEQIEIILEKLKDLNTKIQKSPERG